MAVLDPYEQLSLWPKLRWTDHLAKASMTVDFSPWMTHKWSQGGLSILPEDIAGPLTSLFPWSAVIMISPHWDSRWLSIWTFWHCKINNIFLVGNELVWYFILLNCLLSVSDWGHFRKAVPGLKWCQMGKPAVLLKQCWHLMVTDLLGQHIYRKTYSFCFLIGNGNSLDWGNGLWGILQLSLWVVSSHLSAAFKVKGLLHCLFCIILLLQFD